jgi:hypothetical protein
MKTARQRVFEALHRAGQAGCTTGELCHPAVGGVRFGARLRELREEVQGDVTGGLFELPQRPATSPYDFDDAA